MRQYTKQYIHRLLTKFMDGTTTLEEENILSQYFTQPNIPEEWEEYRLLFAEIEGMRNLPQSLQRKTSHGRRWLYWTAAAAVIVAVLFIITQPQQTGHAGSSPATTALTAKADTTDMLRPEAPNEQPLLDTTALHKQQPVKRKRLRLRKAEPTIHDYDKAYTLIAEVEQEQQAVKQQIAQAKQEITHVQLTAAGFIPVMLEDGTIIYVDEPKEYFAYEE